MILYSDIPIVPLSVVQAVLIRTEKLIEFLFCHFMHRLTHPKKIYHVLPYIISSGIGTLPVIACGRFKTKTTRNLEEGSILRLKKNIILLNKIGKLLKDEPELGRVL